MVGDDEISEPEAHRWSVVALLEPKSDFTGRISTVELRDALALAKVELRARARRVILVRGDVDAATRAQAEDEFRAVIAQVGMAGNFDLTNVTARPASGPGSPPESVPR